MRKFIICLLLISCSFVCGSGINIERGQEVNCYEDVDWDLFMEAIIWRESNGNDKAIGDNGRAVGCMQIWPIMVKEANRLSGRSYTLSDRYNRDKSKEMFMILQEHRNKEMSLDRALHLWNENHPKSYEDAIKRKYEELYWGKHRRYKFVEYGI